MIVITGPGRSGTTALAALYQKLGFDPGGEFNPELRAGFEARDVVALNQKIAHRLRVTIVGKARRRNRLEDFVGGRMAGSIRSRVDPKWLDKMYRRCATLPGRRARRLHLADWQAIESIASDLRTELCEVASRHIVAKDPRFCWTLPVWLACKAPIEHVVMTSRDLDEAISSRSAAGLMSVTSASLARNSLVYGIGLCLTTCWDYGIPCTVLRFPEFLSRSDDLRRAMPLVSDFDPLVFERAVASVIRPEMVHDYSVH